MTVPLSTNTRMFPKPKNLVSWGGLAPAVNESAGQSSNGHITKQGNKYLRTILVQAANSIAIGNLLANNEKYSEEKLKGKTVRLPKFVSLQDIDMDGMIEILCEAGYTINKSSSAG